MPRKRRERGFKFPITSLAGCSLPNFIRLRKDYSIDRRFLKRFLATIAVSAIFEPFRWWEEIRWRKKIKNTTLQGPPIFIIGFWRSGTTLLHDLLCQSEDTSYVTTYQTIFPHMVLSHASWLKPLANLLMPTRRPFDKVDMDLEYPQEEEIAMANIQTLSFYNFFYFPRNYESFYNRDLFFDRATEKQIKKWKKEYRKLIAKALINRPGKRFISKNPPNLARIKVLLEMYPDAKFIFIYRNPYNVVESFYRFLQEVIPAIQLQKEGEDVTRIMLTSLYANMLDYYETNKQLIPAENLMEIQYEDLAQDPVAGVQKIYEQFHLGSLEADLPLIQKYLERTKSIPKNHYKISDRTIELVNENFSALLKRWNYPVKD